MKDILPLRKANDTEQTNFLIQCSFLVKRNKIATRPGIVICLKQIYYVRYTSDIQISLVFHGNL